jgi:hypothetical protein
MTREEIYLALAGRGFDEWADAVCAQLEPVPPQDVDAERIAQVLTAAFEERQWFCDLLGHVSTTLEHHVSSRAARTFKEVSIEAVLRVARALTGSGGQLDLPRAVDIATTSVVLAGPIWAVANPPPILVEVYAAHPRLAPAQLPFNATLQRTLTALVNGLISADMPRGLANRRARKAGNQTATRSARSGTDRPRSRRRPGRGSNPV